ncbi:MAG: type transport system permease protein [Frankiaceae bacterium]|jgi:hypothetical protein|nr:type transport system permease protein [Frankiaceae bacterium]
MTAATAATVERRSPLDGVRVTFPRILRAEWVRFRSLRSSWITLGITVALIIGLAALACWGRASHWPPHDRGELLSFNPTLQSIGPGAIFGQLAVGVLGVLLVTGEYATGMVRATMAAVPRRLPVLIARTVVFALLMLAVLVPSVFAAFFLGQDLLSAKHIDTTIGAPHVLRAVFGAGIYLVGIGLLGMGLGWLLRHTAGAIASLFGILLILPLLVHFLPSPWPDNVTKWLPGGVDGTAGVAVWNTHQGAHSFGPWTGFGVLMAYVAIVLVAAAAMLRTRDV